MDESQTLRVTVDEAARLLGIEKGSVKKRIQRGKLRADKDAKGTTWVYLDQSETVRDESRDQSETGAAALVDALQDQVAYLRDVIATRDEEIRRRDVIISQLTQRIPEIEPPASAEEPSEARESPESPGPTRTPTDAGEGPQTTAERPFTEDKPEPRSWWRRMFGE